MADRTDGSDGEFVERAGGQGQLCQFVSMRGNPKPGQVGDSGLVAREPDGLECGLLTTGGEE